MNHENNIKMKTLPKELMPYHRCKKYGAQSLNDAELLAVILRTGTAGLSCVDLCRSLLSNYQPKGLTFLNHVTINQLKKQKGIGDVKAIQLLCIAELAKRITREGAAAHLDFSKPQTIAEYYMEELKSKTREVVKVIFLNTKYEMLQDMTLSEGTVNASLITPREVFLEALKYEAVHIILLHNHPSGDPIPSKEDFLLTARIREAGRLMNISLDDHIVIGNNRYYSFSEHHALDRSNINETSF